MAWGSAPNVSHKYWSHGNTYRIVYRLSRLQLSDAYVFDVYMKTHQELPVGKMVVFKGDFWLKREFKYAQG